ncbi:MAG: glucosaminidase domain-containing protein [Endomicrobia bacterium]|nr:glucosaminidase domain-containing protein [Endomicrobiia bacterium]
MTTEYIKKDEFVKYAYPCACEVKKRFYIARIISLTQAAHESNFGNSELSKQAKNLFGIKSTKKWVEKGGKVWLGKTTEFIEGKEVKLTDGFRLYDTWLDSFLDWAELISTLSVYKEAYLYAQLGDVKKYGELITGIYATDPKYGEKLVEKSQVIKELCKKLNYEI